MIRKSRFFLSGIDVIAALTLFCVFAVSVLFVLASGAGVYGTTAELLDERYSERVPLAYVTSKAHDGDELGAISAGWLDGLSALIIRERYGDAYTLTYIYCRDGFIRELYVDEGSPVDSSLGEIIIECDSLEFEDVGGGVIRVECDGDEIFIRSRCGEIGGAA